MSTYLVGQPVIVEGKFLLAGLPRDPTLVTFTTLTPSGTATTLTHPDDALVRIDEGLYDAHVLATEAGTWYFRWEAVGVVDAVGEVSVTVHPSNVL
jgi:hypothetical protein